MKLHRLTITNFMPYKGKATAEFPTGDANVMLVFGDNMRGKTSLLNALRWGFYGRALGRHSRPIPLQNLFNKDAALEDNWRVEVFVEFEANDHRYELRRAAERRPTVVSPSRPEDFEVEVHLSREGVLLRADQVEAEIDQIAPEQIARFFLFDGELLQEYESLLIEGSEQGRQIKEAIEQVLGVPSLINGRAELGAILKQATKRQISELAHVQGLEKQAAWQKELTTRQEAHERDLKDLEDKLAKTREDRMKLDDELEAAANVLAYKARIDTLVDQQRTLLDVREKKRLERQALLAHAWQDLLDIKLEVKRRQLLERQTELTRNLQKQGRLQARIADIKKLLATSWCPTCGQEMSDARHSEIGTSLGKLEIERSEVTDETGDLQEVSAQLASLNKIRGVNARERLHEIDKDARAAEVKLTKVENDLEHLREEVAGHDTADLARKRVLQMEKLKEEGRLQGEIKDVQKDLKKTKEDLAVAQKTIEGLAGRRSQRSTLKVSLAQELEQTFSASIERLRDRLRERVGTRANEAFREMTTQKAYRGLEINANYGLSIMDGLGHKVALRSAGAEQVVALSLIDGLNRTGRAVGPVIMDTPFGRLDLKHRDNILSYLPKVTSQFVLLVHSGEVRPDTDLEAIKSKIGAVYRIEEVSPTHSRLEKAAL